MEMFRVIWMCQVSTPVMGFLIHQQSISLVGRITLPSIFTGKFYGRRFKVLDITTHLLYNRFDTTLGSSLHKTEVPHEAIHTLFVVRVRVDVLLQHVGLQGDGQVELHV